MLCRLPGLQFLLPLVFGDLVRRTYFREQYYIGTRGITVSGKIAGQDPARLYMIIGWLFVNISGLLNSFGLALFMGLEEVVLLLWKKLFCCLLGLGLGPKGARGAHCVCIARQFYDKWRKLVFNTGLSLCCLSLGGAALPPNVYYCVLAFQCDRHDRIVGTFCLDTVEHFYIWNVWACGGASCCDLASMDLGSRRGPDTCNRCG